MVQNILFLVLSHICLVFRLSNCKSLRCTLELPFPNKRGEVLSITMVLQCIACVVLLSLNLSYIEKKNLQYFWRTEFSGCHVLGYTVSQSTQISD